LKGGTQISRLSLFFLGPVRVEQDGTPIEITPRKAIALLAYLAVSNRPYLRDQLVSLLWPELDQSHACAALRSTLWALKKAIGEEWLDAGRQTIGLNQDTNLWMDVNCFHDLLAACRTHGHPEGDVCPACLQPLADAAALYQDDFLAGFTLRDSPEFDDWQRLQTEDLRRELSTVLERLARCYSLQGTFEPAIACARRWMALDPLHEPAHRCLMQLYAWAGRRTDAMRQYEECVQVVEQELGLPPQEETVRLFRLIQENIAPSVSPATTHPHNLPHQMTPFVGREEELAEIVQLFEGATCRLLTLVGPGGIGKTRLALEAAAGQIDLFPHGVYFVPLAAVRSADLLVSSIADALQFVFYEGGELRTQVLNYLRGKAMLLVLDNFEYFVREADLLIEILQVAPEIGIMVTSRERLNLREERVLEVEGLRFPQKGLGDSTENYSAVQLFVQCAHRVCSSFRFSGEERPSVVHICRLVEGMPLAIELAARWVRVLSCTEIAVELERDLEFLTTSLQDVPERHRSLQAVFDHSWNLLAEEERAVFRRLSAFRGGFERKAAEEVTGITLCQLSSLLDKSLVRRVSDRRYEVLEVVRQYAEAKLKQLPDVDGATRDAHCAYYATLLHQERADLMARHEETLAKIGQEIENVRVGWEWAVEQGKEKEIERAMDGFFTFYEIQSWLEEGKNAAGRAAETLREMESTTDHPARAKVQTILGRVIARQGAFCHRLGLYDEAQALLQESLVIFRRLDARTAMPFTLNHLGFVACQQGRYAEAKRLCQESLAIGREVVASPDPASRFHVDDHLRVADALITLGDIACLSGNYAEAKQFFQEHLAVCRGGGDRWGTAFSLNNLGCVAGLLGEYTEAKQLCREALTILEMMGHHYAVAATLDSLGNISRELGDYQESGRYFREALKVTGEIQAIPLGLEVLMGVATLLMKEGRPQQAMELATYVLHHPASNKHTQDRAVQLTSELKPQSSSQVIAEPQGKKTREFKEIVEAILSFWGKEETVTT
jgi:predicted ATPase/DNA-binding SARP family transcriptional activator